MRGGLSLIQCYSLCCTAPCQCQATRVKKIFEKVEYAAVAMCGDMVNKMDIHGLSGMAL